MSIANPLILNHQPQNIEHWETPFEELSLLIHQMKKIQEEEGFQGKQAGTKELYYMTAPVPLRIRAFHLRNYKSATLLDLTINHTMFCLERALAIITLYSNHKPGQLNSNSTNIEITPPPH